jgi:hypothetical protein
MAVAQHVVGARCRRHIRGFARSRGSNTRIGDICPGCLDWTLKRKPPAGSTHWDHALAFHSPTSSRSSVKQPIQDPRLQRRGQLARAMTSIATEKPRQPFLPKPLAPARDKRIVAVQRGTDRAQVWPAFSSNISRARRPPSARPLRLRAGWFSSVRSACISPIVLFISSIYYLFVRYVPLVHSR